MRKGREEREKEERERERERRKRESVYTLRVKRLTSEGKRDRMRISPHTPGGSLPLQLRIRQTRTYTKE